jgi:acetyl-CoA carboxylase, biotin carboxylase subunit
VGGIKTNISLFRRILRDPDFRAAKLDTGFLDRMLKRTEDKAVDSKTAEVAAIAAGMFAELGAAVPGVGERQRARAPSRPACLQLEERESPRSSCSER